MEAFLAMNHPTKDKDAEISAEIAQAMREPTFSKSEEADIKEGKENVLQNLKDFIEMAPRKVKRKLQPEKKFGATLLNRLKKK